MIIEEDTAAMIREAAEAGVPTPEDLPTPFDEPPEGMYRDPLICKAFELTERFSTDDSNFLWNAVWPKLSNGRPCFNPSGKYCVRLYLAGKWRKVTVSDVVPVCADGSPAIASSSQPLELWPTILAKAIYTAYAACG